MQRAVRHLAPCLFFYENIIIDPFIVQGEFVAERLYFFLYRLKTPLIFGMLEHFGNKQGNRLHLLFLHAPRSNRRRADPDAAGHLCAFRIIGYPVFICRYTRPVKRFLGFLPGNAFIRKIYQDQVGIGPSGNKTIPLGKQRIGKRPGIVCRVVR